MSLLRCVTTELKCAKRRTSHYFAARIGIRAEIG
jgi:hypothetical protein